MKLFYGYTARGARVWKRYRTAPGNGPAFCVCCHCAARLTRAFMAAEMIIPPCRGGNARIENLRPACASCIKSRGNAYHVAEDAVRAIIHPITPTPTPENDTGKSN